GAACARSHDGSSSAPFASSQPEGVGGVCVETVRPLSATGRGTLVVEMNQVNESSSSSRSFGKIVAAVLVLVIAAYIVLKIVLSIVLGLALPIALILGVVAIVWAVKVL